MPQEATFSRFETFKRSLDNLRRYGGAVLRGEAVIVPVPTQTYTNHVEPLRGDQAIRESDSSYIGWINDGQIVSSALHQANLTVSDAPSLQMDEVDYGRFEGPMPNTLFGND